MTIDYEGPRRKGEHGLEPNHSHYILLDDGTKRRYEMIEKCVPNLMKIISTGQSSQTMPGTDIFSSLYLYEVFHIV
jgi:hypothetical protein